MSWPFCVGRSGGWARRSAARWGLLLRVLSQDLGTEGPSVERGSVLDVPRPGYRGGSWREQRDPIADAQGLGNVVSYEDGAEPLLAAERQQPILQACARNRIEGREWLVEKEEIRIREDRPSQANALRLAARELVRHRVGEVDEAQDLEHTVDGTACCGLPVAPVSESERGVPLYVEPRQKESLLKDERRSQA
jgi:hypothetical protein